MDREEMEMTAEKQNIWFSEMLFPLFTACLAAGVFAGTHMYYVHHIGAFNEIAIVAMLQAGIEGAGEAFERAWDFMGENGWLMPVAMFSLLTLIWVYLQQATKKKGRSE